MFGTTGGLGILRGYLLHDSLDIYRHLPWRETLMAILLAPYLIASTWWRCGRQRQRWPWSGHEAYSAVSLREIRQRFGIRVAQGGSGGGA